MFKKTISSLLLIAALTVGTSVQLFAQMPAASTRKIAATSHQAVIQSSAVDSNAATMSMADHQKQKAAGNKFSTSTKILIGVGIAAAALGIFVFAASRDKIRPFGR